MESLNEVFSWIGANPAWGGIGVFLIAFFESLAMVGLLLPGAAMMFGVGALVATDILPLGPTLLWAALGAIAGDGISFWLGRHYHMRLKTLWPLRNHPELIANATQFFYRHGGKGILFGRFIGPIRPVIPAVAGMLEMPTRRFLLFNIISGILWAPVYVLPGMLFTTSLGLAAEVASRLAVMVGSMLAVAVLLLWLSHLLFTALHRLTYPLMQRILWWSRLHPVAGRIPSSLLDPEQPEARGLTQAALLLLVATLLFAGVVVTLGQGGLLTGLDASLYQTLYHLRTPGVDRMMVFLDGLGAPAVLFPLFALVLLWLLRHGLRRAAAHWVAATGFAALLGLALYGLGHWLHLEALTRPALANALLLATLTCFGFLAVLINRELPMRHRWWVYTLAGMAPLAVGFARFYLGEAPLGALLGVLALGLAWVALLGIGYRNHPAERVAPLPLTLLMVGVIALGLAWHQPPTTSEPSYRPAIAPQGIEPLSQQEWLQGKGLGLPAHRADLRGSHKHPLNVQYAGPLEGLIRVLTHEGWHQPPGVDATSWLVWLNPDTPLERMPVLPQVHDGSYHELLLTRESVGHLLALRLWRSHYRIEGGGETLWLGNVSELRAETRGGLTVPRTQGNFAEAEQRLRVLVSAIPALRLLPSPPPGGDGATLRLTLREGATDSLPPTDSH